MRESVEVEDCYLIEHPANYVVTMIRRILTSGVENIDNYALNVDD